MQFCVATYVVRKGSYSITNIAYMAYAMLGVIAAYGRVAVQLHTFLTAAPRQLHADGRSWVLSENKVV